MLSHVLSLCFSLLVFDSLCSVTGQSLSESTASVSPNSEKNTNVQVLNQQHIEDLITEKLAFAKTLVYPVLLFFGTFGNVLTIVIHKRAVLTSSQSVFFIVLSVADLTLLYSSCFSAWLNLVSGFSISEQNSVLCKLVKFLVYVSGVLSAWTLVAMTAQRAVSVLWPHRANVLCSAGKSKVIVASMVLFIAAIHTHLLYGVRVVNISGHRRCTVSKEYRPFFHVIWSWVDMLIFSLLPWMCLAVSNSLLVWKLNVSVREAKVSLGSGQAHRVTDRKKKATSITVTLIAVSAAFLVFTFPMSFIQVLNFVHWLNGSAYTVLSPWAVYYAYQISHPLWYANSCINFYIYCLTGSKFRREAKQTLSCVFHEDSRIVEGDTKVSTLSSNTEKRFPLRVSFTNVRGSSQ